MAMCVLWCDMLYLLRLRLYKSLHMSGLQCYAHPADGGKAYGWARGGRAESGRARAHARAHARWALGSEFFGEGVEGL